MNDQTEDKRSFLLTRILKRRHVMIKIANLSTNSEIFFCDISITFVMTSSSFRHRLPAARSVFSQRQIVKLSRSKLDIERRLVVVFRTERFVTL